MKTVDDDVFTELLAWIEEIETLTRVIRQRIKHANGESDA